MQIHVRLIYYREFFFLKKTKKKKRMAKTEKSMNCLSSGRITRTHNFRFGKENFQSFSKTKKKGLGASDCD